MKLRIIPKEFLLSVKPLSPVVPDTRFGSLPGERSRPGGIPQILSLRFSSEFYKRHKLYTKSSINVLSGMMLDFRSMSV